MMPIALNSRRRAWTAVSALILLIMLPNLIWLCVGRGLTPWVSGLIIPVLLLTSLFAVSGKKLWLPCLLLAPFAALAPIEGFYIATYLQPTNAQILATLIATNPRETYEYLGNALLPILLCVIAGLLLAFLAARWAWQSSIYWRHRSRALVVAATITLPLMVGVASFASGDGSITTRLHAGLNMVIGLGDSIAPGYPFGLFQRVAEYHSEWRQMQMDATQLDAFRFHAHRISAIRQRQVYVLVIGESSRRDHWQLFGYSRATNPELAKVPNLVPISNMLTSWPASIFAIPLIITRKPINDSDIAWKEASILRAMVEAGFDTYWISNQLPIGADDSPVSTYAYEAQHTSFLNHASLTAADSYDEVLLRPLRDALQDSNKDLFIVLHMMGSHSRYDLRYPATFKQFRPIASDTTDGGLSGYERLRNSYDNTILYTDHVLAGVIDILQKSGAVTALLYESDHGEDLPTPSCNLMEHGHSTVYDFQIPAFAWYSDSYADAFPLRIAALRNNASKPTLSADSFASLIDMAGVTFPGHDPSWSLFSTEWRYRPRIINGMWQTDMDHAVFGKQCKTVMPANS